MSLFKQLIDCLQDPKRKSDLRLWFERRPLPPISFLDVRQVEKPPSNANIENNAFYFVISNNKPKWVLFCCPCGCKSIITLSLQHNHRPHWQLKRSNDSRPTLYPSVWRDIGCMSHFWIADGRVYWCENTGSSPNMFYSFE